MKKIIALLVLIFLINSFQDSFAFSGGAGEGPSGGDGSEGGTPPPQTPNPSPPIDYCAQKGVHCIDKVNERPSGEFVLLDSVSSMYSDKFHFPGVHEITFNAYGGFLTSAAVTASSDDNILWINNPLESAEKIKIYLKNSHTLSYTFSNNEISISIPAGSWINITKEEKSLVIQGTGGDIRISVIRESLGEYRALKYAVQNGNLIYSNGKITEKILSQTIFAFFDMDKGFGYIKLNPKDSFEYYDLEKKENSYSLYNNGNNIFEFGIEDAGLSADILPQISPVNFGYFHTKGQKQILLNGIVAYKRIQSYAQLKLYRHSGVELAPDLIRSRNPP